jgi:hypothetical protein
MVIANIIIVDDWTQIIDKKQWIQIRKSKCNASNRIWTTGAKAFGCKDFLVWGCGRTLTWRQFEVVFALGSHPVAVAATVVPSHVYPPVVNVASNDKLLWETSLIQQKSCILINAVAPLFKEGY